MYDNTRIIELANGKGQVIVDAEDYDWLIQYSWSSDHKGYAKTRNKTKQLFMHRLINKTPDGLRTDHINRNKRDNRKRNLRIATDSQNSANKGVSSKNTSGYKGVWFCKKTKSWVSALVTKEKRHNLGYFESKEAAALAYNKKAEQVHGEFAVLNEIDINKISGLHIARKTPDKKGAKNSKAVLTESKVLEIYRQRHKTQKELAQQFQVSKSAINHILSGRNWSHITGLVHKSK